VFAQSPKAVVEVATLLSTRDSLRRLLRETRSYRGEQQMQIPVRCGGPQVLAAAFDFLEDPHTREDLGRRLAEFIKMNGTREEIDEHWLASAQGPLAGDAARWLWIGRELGSLERVNKVSVAAVLGGEALDRRLIKLLCKAGRYDCILTSNKNAHGMVSYFLSVVPTRHDVGTGGAPLFLLPAFFLLAESWNVGRNRYLYDLFSRTVKRFKSEVQSTAELDLPFQFDFAQQAFELSCKIANVAEGDALALNSALPWEGLIEDCRKMWGERPAIVAAATAICNMRRGSRSRLKPVDLLARDQPICDRIRIAKSQSKSTDWWRAQLTQAQDPASRFLFHFSYWLWRPLASALEMADDIGTSLDALSFDEWSTLVLFISASIDHGYYLSGNQTKANQPLPRRLNSRRLALIVGMKDQLAYGRAAFLDYLVDATEPHLEVAEFRQLRAFEAAVSGALDWRSALSIIRSTYVLEGAAADIERVLVGRRSVILPETVSQQVLAKAKDYPVQLWELAENVASANARRAVRAVGIVAQKERWFVD
jgi:hypothetical protein